MKNILITFKIDPGQLEWLRARYPQCLFQESGDTDTPPLELLQRAEVILGRIDANMMAAAHQLRWFHSVSAGVDMYIDAADRLRGNELQLTNSAGIYGVPISEHLLSLMLAFAHRINTSVQNMAANKWGGVPPTRELTGATVGIVGLGDIGLHLAALLAPFKCEVLAFKRTPSKNPAGISEMLYGSDGLDELVRRSDYVCICLPGTPDTRGLFDARRLALMKRTAILLNIGRGYIVDTDALSQALENGALAGAGLDVTEPEPLPASHRLWSLPNVIVTPHISGYTTPQWELRTTEFFARNLDAYLALEKLPGAVDRVNKY
jgi:phosphoglycerate dehydrogenase-like enzyme